MSPTEKFIFVLESALEAHVQATGTYIQKIHIESIPLDKINTVRAERTLTEIKLEII